MCEALVSGGRWTHLPNSAVMTWEIFVAVETTLPLKIELPSSLFSALTRAAKQNNISVDQMAVDCIAQALETALRHRVLIDRQEELDEALLTIAEFVAKLSAVRFADISSLNQDGNGTEK